MNRGRISLKVHEFLSLFNFKLLSFINLVENIIPYNIDAKIQVQYVHITRGKSFRNSIFFVETCNKL